ncbi:GAF domain-containing SpoIIE family protein phosphatase [Amorphoplanes digitatis]|uniref:GAF domain-containing SpoIIE family protein phosphatase n=1 Tax=Actinoplanes digitatis TaxID=1868 RepID=UPI0023B28413|nr:SpoIIE family protein phosphatase [Actinoplanes digitatis]
MLRQTGLTAAADPACDRFAAMVRNMLNVPIGLVALIEPERQVLPGASGLSEPWQQQRQTPLSYAPGQHVATGGAPLVIEDARTDPRSAGTPAVRELNVVAYAGMPLTDETGVELGTLCAIDTAPRRWTGSELALLGDLAAACSDGLRLRIANSTAQRRSAESDAALDRSQLLLRASVALANTSTADDVAAVVHDLVTGTLNPAHVEVSLLDRSRMVSWQSGPALPASAARWSEHDAIPSGLAVRTGAAVLLPDLAAVRALTPDAVDTYLEMGWQSAASVPLPGFDGRVGALTFVWKQPHVLDHTELTILTALAVYTAQALQRADYLRSRENVAAILQRAMLSDVPDSAPFELAARYEPAARGEQVGGDWYDAVRLDLQYLALVIGDVTGHDMRAAALMGRVRSKLRLLLVDRHEPPAALLRRLDSANQALGDRIIASAVLAYLRPEPGGDGHQLQWSNAGHPNPLLLDAAGVTVLTGHDPLLGVTRRTPRTSHTRHLPPGSTVLFYTDGLIETREHPFDERERELHAALAGLHDLPLTELLDRIYAAFAGDDQEDDVALLAVRTPPRQ